MHYAQNGTGSPLPPVHPAFPQTFSFKTVTSDQFKDYFLNYFK